MQPILRLFARLARAQRSGSGLATGPGGQSNYSYREPHIAPRTYAILVVPVTCIGLGTWQVYRRQWKLLQIKNLEDKTHRPAVDLPAELNLLQEMEYQKVLLRGSFDYSRETYIGPRTLLNEGGGLMSGSSTGGVHVVTPFKLVDRDLTVLVNRGWVPQSYAFPKASSNGVDSRPAIEHNRGADEVVVISGIVRLSETRQPFAPKDVRTRGMWLRRDVDAIAAQLGTAAVFVDAVGQTGRQTDRGYPVGSQTRVTLRNEHLSYILTWYSLAAITLWIFYARYVRKQPFGVVRYHSRKT